jgi:hypothetical protein
MSFNIQNLRRTAQSRISIEIRKSFGTTVEPEELIRANNQAVLLERKLPTSEQYHIFLSHNFLDTNIILGVLTELNNLGYRVYVDWINDPLLDRRNVTKETAKTLRIRMNQSRCLLYATSRNASQSRWMPWELGYMDGKKDRAAIIPLFESESTSSYYYKGQEYLDVYPYCIKTNYKYFPDKEGLWIHEDEETSVPFDDWLKGKKPTK